MPSREVLSETARKEVNMLLHLPIAILATLSPIAVSDTVPKFDTVRECNFEGGPSVDVARCSRDEAAALRQLQQAWAQYASADRKACTAEATIAGFASYVELLTCLEMARDVESADNNTRGPGVNSKLRPVRPTPHGVTVGVGDGPISSRSGR
jgi:hypothetical protein